MGIVLKAFPNALAPLCLALALMATPPSTSAQCRLSGTGNLEAVRIQPRRGAPSFEIDLVEQAMVVDVGSTERTRMRSTGAVAFSGTAPLDGLMATPRRPIPVGALRIGPGFLLERVRSLSPGRLETTAELQPGVRARLSMPCRALTLATERIANNARPSDAPRDERIHTTGRHLRVFREPGGTQGISLRFGPNIYDNGGMFLAEIARVGDWVHIRHRFSEYADLDGWVHLSDVSTEERRSYTLAPGIGVAGRGMCGRGASHTYVGPATLNAGALIYTPRGAAVWGSIRREVEARVYWHPGDEWMQLEELEGLRSRGSCPNLIHSFASIRARDVVLPPDSARHLTSPGRRAPGGRSVIPAQPSVESTP